MALRLSTPVCSLVLSDNKVSDDDPALVEIEQHLRTNALIAELRRHASTAPATPAPATPTPAKPEATTFMAGVLIGAAITYCLLALRSR